MDIKNIKEFKALIKACRQLGITNIEVSGIKAVLGPITQPNSPSIDNTAFPEASIKVPAFNGPISDVEPVETQELSPDQLMFYSAQGHEQVEQ